MKNLLTAVFVILSFTFFSCQKEVDDIFSNNGNNSGGGNGTKLVRIGTRAGTDSITTDFSYNGSNRLSAISYSGTVTGIPITAQIKIIRNASNIITSTIIKSNAYASVGVDSVVTNCVYDAANSRYSYIVASYAEFGVASSDSSVFSYSGGKLVSSIDYHNDGSGYQLDSKDSVYYNGNNIASIKSYSYNGSGFDLDAETKYDQYDNRISPLYFAEDAPVLGMTTYYSANNVVQRTMIDYATNDSQTGIFTYLYNASNRPTKSVSTDGTNSSTSTYYYQ